MKIGYVTSFDIPLKQDVKFAKGSFDFLEVCIDPKNSRKEYKTEFPVMGHLFWERDMTAQASDVFTEIKKLSALGAKVVTIHPTHKKMEIKKLIHLNINGIRKIAEFSAKYNIKLLLENCSDPVFSRPEPLLHIIRECGLYGMTFDIGHARKRDTLESFFEKEVSSKIKHAHLHAVRNGIDHLVYKNKAEFSEDLKIIRKMKNIKSVSFEFFAALRNGAKEQLTYADRKGHLLRYLKLYSELR